MAAVWKDNPEICELLLRKGHARPDIHDKDKSVPLTVAAEAGYKDVVQVLLEYKANPNKVLVM